LRRDTGRVIGGVRLSDTSHFNHLIILDTYNVKENGLSQGRVPSIVLDVYARVFSYVCDRIANSQHLSLLIDGTTDLKQRSPIAIRMTGVHKDNSEWSYPVRFCEPCNHEAKTQLREIETMFHEINTLSSSSRTLSILDLETIVFDTTSSNTGLKKGLAGLLIRKREENWTKEGNSGPVPKLQIQKCQDHVLNLMSVDYENELIQNSSCVMNPKSKKHRATDVVQFLISKVSLSSSSSPVSPFPPQSFLSSPSPSPSFPPPQSPLLPQSFPQFHFPTSPHPPPPPPVPHLLKNNK
jgi:hypothetical protein